MKCFEFQTERHVFFRQRLCFKPPPGIDFLHYAKLCRVSIHTHLVSSRWSTTRNYGAYLLIYNDFATLLVNNALKFQ